MKLSARNILKGTVVSVELGATTAHVKIDVGGAVITSSITVEAAKDLALKKGDPAYAVIKSSDVIVGRD
jgi:molybdopterin-binding protein